MIRQKKNTKKSDRKIPQLVLGIVLGVMLVIGILLGAIFGMGSLRDVWREQFRIANKELDVRIQIQPGKMVHPDVVTLHFGLTNGANLATIPFESRRQALLSRVPNIRDIQIKRLLPNGVIIDVFEREPLIRVSTTRDRGETGRMADAEGVVFRFSNNTSLYPLVREAADAPTSPGRKLTGNAAAALRLVEAAAQQEHHGLRVLEIDTSYSDYLLVTLSNYDRAKIAWDHMHEDSPAARESLRKQLQHLASAIEANLTPSTTMWIATDWGKDGRIYASPLSSPGNQ